MEYGIFTVGDVTTDPTTGITPTENERIKATVAIAEKAEEIGLDVFATGEHHNPPFAAPANPPVLLAHLAAGVFVLILRPFKVGDFIAAGGVQGTVEEVGLFVTRLKTLDNVDTYIGNNKIFSDTIQNFSANSYRRVDLVAQLHNAVDHMRAIQLLKERLAKIPNVASEPRPDVEILSFNPLGPMLAVRPYCNNAHYWQVYFDTNRAIREVFGEAGFPAAEQPIVVRTNGDRASVARHA